MNYWELLKLFKLYSLERRRERYRIIYTWKILENLVPNMSQNPITKRSSIRYGRQCIIASKNSKATIAHQNLKFNSFPVHGPRLFNKMPKEIRALTGCSTDIFKSNLDKFLSLIPDEPLVVGYTQFRRSDSNSILDMIYCINPDTMLRSSYTYIPGWNPTFQGNEGGNPLSPR